MVSMPSKLSEHHILHITMSSMANHSNFPKLPFLITIMHMQPHWSRSIKIFHELKNKICKWQYYAWHTKLVKKKPTFIALAWRYGIFISSLPLSNYIATETSLYILKLCLQYIPSFSLFPYWQIQMYINCLSNQPLITQPPINFICHSHPQSQRL